MFRLSRLLRSDANPMILVKRKTGMRHRKQRLLPVSDEKIECPPIVQQIQRAADDKVRSVKVWDILAKAGMLNLLLFN